jgi:flagellar protein FlgJ
MKVGDPKGAAAMALDNISTQVPMRTKVEDSPEAIMEAAKAFEAVFLNEIMKSMRKTLPEDGILNGGFANSTFNSMLDQEYAQIASRSGQVGLADMLALQLNRGEPLDLADAPAREPGGELDARRMSSAHVASSRARALRDVPAAAIPGSAEAKLPEAVMIDGEEVPAWLLEEIPDEVQADPWEQSDEPEAPSQAARQRAISAYQRLKR